MSKPEPPQELRPPLFKHWPTLVSLLTAIVATATVTLHFIGQIRHRHYLHHWGVDSEQFPKPTDWILINGYYGLVDRILTIFVAIKSNLHWWAIGAAVLGIYAFLLTIPTSESDGTVPTWLQKQPEWRRRLIKSLMLSAIFMALLPLALAVAVAFMAVPAALGETAGADAATKEMADFRKGWDASNRPCIQLTRDGRPIGKGYILDSSSSHIAIFDVGIQRGRVVPLDGVEIVSVRAPD